MGGFHMSPQDLSKSPKTLWREVGASADVIKPDKRLVKGEYHFRGSEAPRVEDEKRGSVERRLGGMDVSPEFQGYTNRVFNVRTKDKIMADGRIKKLSSALRKTVDTEVTKRSLRELERIDSDADALRYTEMKSIAKKAADDIASLRVEEGPPQGDRRVAEEMKRLSAEKREQIDRENIEKARERYRTFWSIPAEKTTFERFKHYTSLEKLRKLGDESEILVVAEQWNSKAIEHFRRLVITVDDDYETMIDNIVGRIHYYISEAMDIYQYSTRMEYRDRWQFLIEELSKLFNIIYSVEMKERLMFIRVIRLLKSTMEKDARLTDALRRDLSETPIELFKNHMRKYPTIAHRECKFEANLELYRTMIRLEREHITIRQMLVETVEPLVAAAAASAAAAAAAAGAGAAGTRRKPVALKLDV
jgi:hypothetical protein